MSGTALRIGPLLGVVLLALVGYAALVVTAGQLRLGRQVAVAAVRAVVQLGAVSLVIVVVLRSGWLTAGFVALMFAVAAVTSAGRVTGGWRGWPATSLAIAAGVAPVLALVLLAGAVPTRTIAVLPIAGILIGGAMTATSLAGRRARDELHTRHGEYEAGLAIGLLPREAALEICRPAATQALVPALDQTRTVGLVTLPGAFVGVLLGGASPVQAGAVQVLVLIGLLAVEAVAALVTVELVAAARLGPGRRPRQRRPSAPE